ncbi:MAG: efflux RND transporter permease subunit [Planctomycetota bacterium]
MSLSAFALKYRAIVITAVALLMIVGVAAYVNMPRSEDPGYTVRTCTVTTSWPGAPTEKVEELITDKIEKAVDTMDEVDYIKSTTTVGLSTVYVYAEDWVTAEAIDNVWDKVRARVVKVEMPEEGIVPVVNDEFGDTYVMLIAVHQTPMPGEEKIREENRYTLRQLDIFSEKIRDAVKLIPGVAKAEEYGVRDEAIYVETDLGVWTLLSLTTTQLQQLASARNIIAPGGTIDTPGGRFSVKPGGELNAVRELETMTVGGVEEETGHIPVYLRDIGVKVVREYQDPPSVICRYGDGHTSQPCVVVAYTMKEGVNVIELSAVVQERLAVMRDVEQIIPPDIGWTLVSDQAENVDNKIKDFVVNVVEAIVIVVAVVYLMVGFRVAAVMAANIPLVVLSSLALMPFFGVHLEQISIASMIIALGMLVDNAVQICDQTRRLEMEGQSPYDAALNGANQLSFPILIATLTTVAAFVPMLIGLQGSKREYVYSLPITLSVTLGISYVLAMTFCVLLAYWFIRAPKDPSKPDSPLSWLIAFIKKRLGRGEAGNTGDNFAVALYGRLTGVCLKAKFLSIAVSLGLLIGSLMLPIGSQFFPRDLRDQFAVEVWLPEEVSIKQTDAATKQVEDILRKLSPTTDSEGKTVQQIRGMRTMVGGDGARWYLGRAPEPLKPNYAEILIRTTDPQFTHDLAVRVGRIAVEGDTALGIEPVVGARVIPRELEMGPSVDAPIGIRIYGAGFADIPTLRSFAKRLKDIVRKHPGAWDIHDAWGSPGFQVYVDIDQDRANVAGVTNLSVAQTLNAYLSGHYLTTFREGDHLVPVYLRLPSKQRGALDDLWGAYVEGQSGKIPLTSIAEIRPRWDPAKIERRKLNRMIEVRARVKEGYLANDVLKEVLDTPEMKQLEADLPSDFWVELGGEMEETVKSQKQMSVSLAISLLLIILCLVVQYNGWAKPIIIMATVPLALIGAFLGLFITGQPLGFMPQLGLLSLFGVVVNTAIIYIEFAEIELRNRSAASDGSGPVAGLTKKDFYGGLVKAGKVRLLPIALTTLTTIGGLIPLALFGGPLWEGMAWLMIFGLALATILTVILVPVLYAIFVEFLGMKPFPDEA